MDGNLRSLAEGVGVLVVALCVGCTTEQGELDVDTAPVVETGCGDDLIQAEACDDVFCGDPLVTIGTGGSEFESVNDGDVLSLFFGSNGGSGGYHVFLSVQTEQLCPIVWLEPRLEAQVDGVWHTLYDERLHVLAVRPDAASTEQVYWGIRAPIPCAFWPGDMEREASCGEFQSRYGRVDDLPLRVSVVATDHDGREQIDERYVEASCCGE